MRTWLANFTAGCARDVRRADRHAGADRRGADGRAHHAGQDGGQTHSAEVLLYGADDYARVSFLQSTDEAAADGARSAAGRGGAAADLGRARRAGRAERGHAQSPLVDWYRLRPWLGTLVRLVLGVVWLWAGWAKLRSPRTFVQAVRAYDATPEWLSKAIGYGLPVLEVCLGVLLIVGVVVRMAAAVSGVLLVVFLIGIIQAAARGIKLELRLLRRRRGRPLDRPPTRWTSCAMWACLSWRCISSSGR